MSQVDRAEMLHAAALAANEEISWARSSSQVPELVAAHAAAARAFAVACAALSEAERRELSREYGIGPRQIELMAAYADFYEKVEAA